MSACKYFLAEFVRKVTAFMSGALNEKQIGKGLECSFRLSHIIVWSFKGIFVRANTF